MISIGSSVITAASSVSSSIARTDARWRKSHSFYIVPYVIALRKGFFPFYT